VRVPVAGLISKKYAADLARTINPGAVTPSSTIRSGDPFAYEPSSTTHFSIMDKDGNAVANTYTLEDSFGSAATVRGAGFLLNNEMGDFAAAPGLPNAYGLVQGEANAIAPRKRPLSSMTPAMVLKDGKVFLIIGSPGGGTIINTVLQVILNIVEFGMDVQEAIDAPRIHHQWLPDEIYWEPFGVNPDTRRVLEARGHKFKERSGYTEPGYIGDAQAVAVDPKTGARLGASDPRRGGIPVGY
jgi:gamma-glutamyltranspeptidase/glutathione hydrolase